jgi:hypothetical protein
MQRLTPQWQQKINDLAQQYDVSTDAVISLLQAVINGNGTMAQFSHPELGGSGQWMQGGMTMVGDMFNSYLKMKIEGLCADLANFMMNQPTIYVPLSNQPQNQNQQQQQKGGYGDFIGNNYGTGNWWPSNLGMTTMTGAQNNMRYAYFAETRRLAIDFNGQITVFDTLDHQIGGVSQQQGSNLSVTFTSQYGTVDLLNLPVISSESDTALPPEVDMSPPNVNPPDITTNEILPETNLAPTQTDVGSPQAFPETNQPPVDSSLPMQETIQTEMGLQSDMDIFTKIEKLAELRQKGIISEEEFFEKKTELLSRL